MPVITSRFDNPSELFNITIEKEGFPFDTRFITNRETLSNGRVNPDYFGPGIYSIFNKEQNKLVYAGLHNPLSTDRGVVEDRFRKHIQTLTLRGTQVAFKRSPNTDLDTFLVRRFDTRIGGQRNVKNQGLLQALANCQSMTNGMRRLYADRVVSNAGKPRHADQNWKYFGTWESPEIAAKKLDKVFFFQYDQLSGVFASDLTSRDRKRQLQGHFEAPLISEFNPTANNEYNFDKDSLCFSCANEPHHGPDRISAFLRTAEEDYKTVRP